MDKVAPAFLVEVAIVNAGEPVRANVGITESALVDDIGYMTKQIERFKDLGFTVWMDDYGSGYSSPVVLQTIPFDLIKIDMLFVSQISERKSGKIIITELVRMAMALGLDTIAEGVETKEQMEFLKEVGCTKLQGYYFSKPLSLEEIFEREIRSLQRCLRIRQRLITMSRLVM